MFGLNAWRAGRLRRDAPWLIAGVAIALITALSAVYWLPNGQVTADGFRLSHRVLALLLASIWYSRLRPSFRAQDLMGSTTASPWLAAIGAIAMGYTAYLAIAAYLGFLR